MWKVEVIQYVKYKYAEGYQEVSVKGEFNSLEDAKMFATLFLKGFKRSTVTLVYEESNYQDGEENK